MPNSLKFPQGSTSTPEIKFVLPFCSWGPCSKDKREDSIMMIEEESVSDDFGNEIVTMSVADGVSLPVTMVLKSSERRFPLLSVMTGS